MLSSHQLRRVILDQAYRAGEGHIGSALSVADIVVAIQRVARWTRQAVDNDHVILSKGHAALALYAALHLTGRLSAAELGTYCGEGSRLGVHPQHGIDGVEFTTGSLGQGITFATGCALAARVRHEHRRTFVLCSDAECDEGSLWEAAMFAAHQQLGDLAVVVDYNGQQAMGATDSVLSLGDLRARWEAFGWRSISVDGHDVDAVTTALSDRDAGRPLAVIANTIFGYGVPFMERQLEWHYKSMSALEYAQARDAVTATS